uniref:Cytosolic invertase 1-like n=1 Tax=Nicotiana tabacum TaxID=4097 RepID=A0A1S3ZM07_TOBAC|nr:PREDICTED: cytosolic invertase 1-like [Nicotiana tabacum]
MFHLFGSSFPSMVSSWNDLLLTATVILYGPSQLVPKFPSRGSLLAYVLALSPFEDGIFLVNINPARMDFRSFLVVNFIAIFSSLVTPTQEATVMDLIEERWEEWIREMPLKITYPALEGHEWRIVTGFDPKNIGRSYLIGESWLG